MRRKIYPALKAVIVKRGKILVLKRSSKEDCSKETWDIPGGKIEFGEIPEKALKREIKEEAGVDVEILTPLRIWSFFKNKRTQVFGVTILCKYKKGKVKLSEEHTAYKWIKPEEIENLDTHEGIRRDIRKAKEFLKRKIFF